MTIESHLVALRNENHRSDRCWSAAVLLLAVIGGCTAYEAAPLEPGATVERVARTRLAPSGAAALAPPGAADPAPTETLTLTRAAAWMREHGPDVRDAIAAYQTSLAVAKTPTPLPNPSLELGPAFGFGSDVVDRELTAFGAIGFAIPTGGRLHHQDQLNLALAELARVRAITELRELYLALRRRFAGLAIARTREGLLVAITAAAHRSLAATQVLVEAGQATAIDVALFELEHAQTRLSSIKARMTTVEVESALARQVGVSRRLFRHLPAKALPEVPDELPTADALQRLLVAHRSGLLIIKSEYIAAERSLRLEIARQYPDFRFGPSLGGEAGERKSTLGLTLGIDVPLFDRNQQAIARATRQREAVRTRYESEANRALADLDAALATVALARERRRILLDTVLPRAEANIAIARRTVAAGAGSTLRLLDAERSFRNIQIDALDAQLAELSAWSALEQAVGCPLLAFPGEDAGTLQPPALLRQPADSTVTQKDGDSR